MANIKAPTGPRCAREVHIPLRKPLLRTLTTLALGLPVLYALPAAALWFGQDMILFPAPGLSLDDLDAQAAAQGASPLWLVAQDGVDLYAWHFDNGGDRLIIYFHGNASSPAAASGLSQQVASLGYGLLAPSYRGYSPSQGSPSEQGLIEDAREIWRYATQDLGVDPSNIVLHGRSLGGGVAVALASEVQPRAVILECTFASVREVAQSRYPIYPVRLLLRHPFDSEARAPGVQAPVLLVHGDQDQVVPVEHGRRLAEAFPDATYIEVPGEGHGGRLLRGEGRARQAWLEMLAR